MKYEAGVLKTKMYSPEEYVNSGECSWDKSVYRINYTTLNRRKGTLHMHSLQYVPVDSAISTLDGWQNQLDSVGE